jgi:hypothetical protein
MDWSALFSLVNGLALAGWAVLLLAPRRWTLLGWLPRVIVPGIIALLYVALMGAYVADAGGGFGSIAEVRTLFMSDPVLVAGWGHYLAFDLLIGSLLADRLDRAGVTRWLQAPVLLLTFLFGPAGWLLGLATEAGARWRPQAVARAGA